MIVNYCNKILIIITFVCTYLKPLGKMTLIHEYFNLMYFSFAKNMAENLKSDATVLYTSQVKSQALSSL